MSLVVEHMKADLILKDILSGKIISLKEVEEKMGESDYYKLWAKNIWEYHTTEAPSLDLRTQFPSKEKIKQYKLTSDGKYFIVNAKTEEEAIEKVKKITNKEVILSNIKFKVNWIKIK